MIGQKKEIQQVGRLKAMKGTKVMKSHRDEIKTKTEMSYRKCFVKGNSSCIKIYG